MASLGKASLLRGNSHEDGQELDRFDQQEADLSKTPDASSAALPPRKLHRSATYRIRQRLSDSWTIELASLFLSAASFCTLLAILSLYNGKPLSRFGSSTTINTVISVLITLSEFSLVFPVSEALCQHQWMHMRNAQSRGRPLTDLRNINRAAYSSVGAINMLAHSRRYSFAVLLGAIAMVAHLLVGPFAQQAVHYPVRSTALLTYGDNNATITRAQSLFGRTDTMGFDQNAVSAAINVWTNARFPPDYTCSNANCSWDPFPSVGICTKCVDVTADITPECGSDGNNGTMCNAVFPGGARVPDQDGSYKFTTYYQDACEYISWNGSSVPEDDLIATQQQSNCSFEQQYGERLGGLALPFAGLSSYQGGGLDVPVTALECALHVCVKEYRGVSVVNGTFQPGNAMELPNQSAEFHVPVTAPPANFPFPYNASITLTAPSQNVPRPDYSRGWDPSYDIETGTLGTASYALFNLFRPNATSQYANPVWDVSRRAWFEQQWATPGFNANYSALVPKMLDSLAEAMTSIIRNQGPKEPYFNANAGPYSPLLLVGQTWAPQVFIQVRWLWLTLPAAVVVLGAVFIFTTIWQTARSGLPTWKSSILALVYHGLDNVRSVELEGLERLGDMEDHARRCDVRLTGSEHGVRRTLTKIQSD
ncbi:hypothetical protein LTR86_004856 [Recurvomyces mirabilis]|nr:hypothetical protein LTR86_004856 [Recurvomyces mirabilis]